MRGAVAALAAALAWPAAGAPLGGEPAAGEFSATFAAVPQWRFARRHSPYYSPPTADETRSARLDLLVKARRGGWNGEATLRRPLAEDETPARHAVVHQLYHDGEASPGLGYTLGRKVLSWGVGHGFKPLDVVQREDRRLLNPPPLSGTPLLALERFGADDALALVLDRPATPEAGLALRYYRLAEGDDLHAVARVSRHHGLEAGAGFARAVGEEWTFHAAALVQGRHTRRGNALADGGGLLATSDPNIESTGRRAAKAVLGSQWTGASGFGVLLEAWYDAAAWSHGQWRRLDALAARQHALAAALPAGARGAVDGNIAWSSRAYQASNLLRENLLLRLSYEHEGWKSSLEILDTPRDGGRVLSAEVSRQGDRQRLAAGVRFPGGRDGSAYAQAPVGRQVYAEWRLAVF